MTVILIFTVMRTSNHTQRILSKLTCERTVWNVTAYNWGVIGGTLRFNGLPSCLTRFRTWIQTASRQLFKYSTRGGYGGGVSKVKMWFTTCPLDGSGIARWSSAPAAVMRNRIIFGCRHTRFVNSRVKTRDLRFKIAVSGRKLQIYKCLFCLVHSVYRLELQTEA